jgi:hypothetical protein
MSAGARMLPNPTNTGGAPKSRNATRSGGSGRSSGSTHAPVWVTSRAGVVRHGPRTESAASHGWPVKMWSRTLSTGVKPADSR